MKEEKQYSKGYFIEMGLVLGIPLGIPIALALGSIAFGPLIGTILGLTTGFLLEKKLNKNPIELSEKEKSKKKKVYSATLIVGLVLFVGMFLHLYLK